MRDIIKKHRMAQTYLQWFDDNSFHWIHTDHEQYERAAPGLHLLGSCQAAARSFSRASASFCRFSRRSSSFRSIWKFAYEASDDRFTLVQMRPLSVYDDKGKVNIPDVPP